MSMFKELIDLLRGEGLIASSLKNFTEMMKEVDKMYTTTTQLIFGKFRGKEKDIKQRIYREDIFINKSERKIRKKVIEHLAFQRNVDIASSLIMMSVVKDAERIGDFCKNLYEVHEMYPEFNKKHKYYNKFYKMSKRVDNLITLTESSFRKSNKIRAKKVMREAHKLGKECDSLLIVLANSKLTAKEAVSLALISRYFKRISSHLGNIASSVIYPVHKIDYSPDERMLADS